MKRLLGILMIAALTLNLSACGLKGKLKSPSQIAREQAKKQKRTDEEKGDVPPSPASPVSPASPESPTSPASQAGAQ